MFLQLVTCICIGAAAVVHALPSQRGVCAIQCSPGFGLYEDLNLAPCPKGQVCHSTGCGAMCVHVHLEPVLINHCGATPMCDLWCPNGFAKDENGCAKCSCDNTAVVSRARKDCSPVMCEIYCKNGFAIGDDGCPHCSCNPDGVLTLKGGCDLSHLALCDVYCPYGQAVDANGCTLCRCNPAPNLGTLGK